MPQGFCCHFILVFFLKKIKVILGYCHNLYLLNIIKKKYMCHSVDNPYNIQVVCVRLFDH